MLLKVTVYHIGNVQQCAWTVFHSMKNVLSSEKSQEDSNVPGSNPVKSDIWDRIGNPNLSHTVFGELEKKMKKRKSKGSISLTD